MKVCIYCRSVQGQRHEGFCLTVMEGDREEWESLTPIYDALVLERAINDEEGRGLVAAIHERQRERRLATLMMLGGGMFR